MSETFKDRLVHQIQERWKVSETFQWKTAWLDIPLIGVSLLYESLIWIRLWLYQKGFLKSIRLPKTVISVGNLTLGGTGKTPVVELLINYLQTRNKKSVVLSRGYGRSNPETLHAFQGNHLPSNASELYGDEPTWLSLKNPELPIYVCSNRVKAAYAALSQEDPDVFILDDGYQHLAMARDFNLLLIDAERGLGNRHLLPLGPLREPEYQWQRADAILITKSNLGFSDRLIYQLQKELHVDCPIFKAEYLPHQVVRLDGKETHPVQWLQNQSVIASCGIAQPYGFQHILERMGAQVEGVYYLDDHQLYDNERVQDLLSWAQQTPDALWVTTEKDQVKLQAFPELHDKLWALEMTVAPEAKWYDFLDGLTFQPDKN